MSDNFSSKKITDLKNSNISLSKKSDSLSQISLNATSRSGKRLKTEEIKIQRKDSQIQNQCIEAKDEYKMP
jgi:hypothetical protein